MVSCGFKCNQSFRFKIFPSLFPMLHLAQFPGTKLGKEIRISFWFSPNLSKIFLFGTLAQEGMLAHVHMWLYISVSGRGVTSLPLCHILFLSEEAFPTSPLGAIKMGWLQDTWPIGEGGTVESSVWSDYYLQFTKGIKQGIDPLWGRFLKP